MGSASAVLSLSGFRAQSVPAASSPSLSRSPGYPLFLAARQGVISNLVRATVTKISRSVSFAKGKITQIHPDRPGIQLAVHVLPGRLDLADTRKLLALRLARCNMQLVASDIGDNRRQSRR